MRRLLILMLLTMACSGPQIHEVANTGPVHPLPPPNPEVEQPETAHGAEVESVSLAVVDIPLPPQEEMPEWDWEKIYFEEIVEREKLSSMRSLRSRVVAEGDLELRVWRGFGIMLLEGFVLRRSSGRWSAVDLGWASSTVGKGNHRVSPKDKNLPEPEAGWEGMWQRLSALGILNIPRNEETTCPAAGMMDGFSYVIEYKANGKYRNYMYNNPDGDCDEERRVLEIMSIIDDEFHSS